MDPNTEKTFLGSDELPLYTPTQDEKTMALLSHVLTLLVSLFAPLVIYLIKKDTSKFVAAHAKESLNFQITMMLFLYTVGHHGSGFIVDMACWHIDHYSRGNSHHQGKRGQALQVSIYVESYKIVK